MSAPQHSPAVWLQPAQPNMQQLRAQCAAAVNWQQANGVAAYVEADSLAKEYAETFNAPPVTVRTAAHEAAEEG